MTSSFRIAQRKRYEEFSQDNVGPWYDTFVRSSACMDCPPGYRAHAIGRATGPKICQRIRNADGTLPGYYPVDHSEQNGFHKFHSHLYGHTNNPKGTNPIQLHNPDAYSDRRAKHEQELVRKRYLRPEVKFNGTGIELVRTPGNARFVEYAFGHDPTPPPKYDVTRLTQPYDLWKQEQEYLGRNTSKYDKDHTTRIV